MTGAIKTQKLPAHQRARKFYRKPERRITKESACNKIVTLHG
jgi:hypothetical protein